MKSREFWIYKNPFDSSYEDDNAKHIALNYCPLIQDDKIHVIEHLSYQSALDRIKELENRFLELFKLFDKDLLIEIDKAKAREQKLVEALQLIIEGTK